MYGLELTYLLRRKRISLRKLVAVVGGLLIMAGIILLGMAALAIIGFMNPGILFGQKYLLTFAVLMLLVGLFDAFAAVIIARW